MCGVSRWLVSSVAVIVLLIGVSGCSLQTSKVVTTGLFQDSCAKMEQGYQDVAVALFKRHEIPITELREIGFFTKPESKENVSIKNVKVIQGPAAYVHVFGTERNDLAAQDPIELMDEMNLWSVEEYRCTRTIGIEPFLYVSTKRYVLQGPDATYTFIARGLVVIGHGKTGGYRDEEKVEHAPGLGILQGMGQLTGGIKEGLKHGL